jgi:hypothetical protein
MNTKLTLMLDKQVIEKAKIYAKSHQTSLSKMVETFLASVDDERNSKIEIGPLTQALSGGISFPPGTSDYKGYLRELKASDNDQSLH